MISDHSDNHHRTTGSSVGGVALAVGAVALEVVVGDAISAILRATFAVPALLVATRCRNRAIVWGIVLASLLGGFAVAPVTGTMLELLGRLVLLGTIGELGYRWSAAVDEARRIGERDALTGLFNSAGLRRRLEEEASRLDRGGRSFSLAVLDCDNFKEVNDRFGHVAGDECLRLIGATLVEATRTYDVVARLGGDEFAVLLADTGADSIDSITGRLRETLERAVEPFGWGVGFAFGTASFEEPPQSPDAAIAAADRAMYDDKQRRGIVRSATASAPPSFDGG